MEPEPFDAVAAVRDLAELATARVEDRVSVEVRVLSPRIASVAMSPRHFDRAVDNVLRNACRFATAKVSVSVAEEDGDLVVTVDDDGPGIAPADRARVLQPFVRLDEGGMGLGLSIVRRIVARRGGSLVVGEAPGGGARVCLRLPTRG